MFESFPVKPLSGTALSGTSEESSLLLLSVELSGGLQKPSIHKKPSGQSTAVMHSADSSCMQETKYSWNNEKIISKI